MSPMRNGPRAGDVGPETIRKAVNDQRRLAEGTLTCPCLSLLIVPAPFLGFGSFLCLRSCYVHGDCCQGASPGFLLTGASATTCDEGISSTWGGRSNSTHQRRPLRS